MQSLAADFVGNPVEQRALCPIHTADADATKQFCRVGVGGVYWALFRPNIPVNILNSLKQNMANVTNFF